MKITVWNECYVSGGADWSLIDLISRWPDREDTFRVYVNFTHEGYRLLEEKLRARAEVKGFTAFHEKFAAMKQSALGKPVISLGMPGRLAVAGLAFLWCLGSYWGLVSRKECDALLMNNGGYPGGISNFAAALVAKFKGIPRRVMILRNYPQGDVGHSMVMKICRALIGFSVQRVVAVSDSLKTALETNGGLAPDRVVRIYNGVDAKNKFSGADGIGSLEKEFAGHPKVAIVGSLEERKGHDVLLRAWADVIKAQPQARLFVAGSATGEPDRKAYLINLAKTLGIRESVVWLDFVYDIGRFYDFIDIVVMPSRRYESFGRAVIEGMAFNKFVIASRVGGIPELIDDGQDGCLFENGDHVKLASVLIWVLSHPEERRMKAEKARQKYESRFTAEIMAENYHRLLRSIP